VRFNYQVLFPAVGLLLAVLGWPLAARLVPLNRWYGLRVPATLADEGVWYEANAVAGRDMMLLGGAVAILALALPHVARLDPTIYAGICAALLGLGSMILSIRGWRLANRLLREHRRDGGAGGKAS
jgi:SdpI/YhfL family protein